MTTQDLTPTTAAQGAGEDILYKRLALRISELIQHGTLRPGERVPSVRKCSGQQNVSIATVMQAYRLLENRGVMRKLSPEPVPTAERLSLVRRATREAHLFTQLRDVLKARSVDRAPPA